ncbi:MAG: polysaccharide biosynthesis/export family protein [Candidatus Krumholzibacteria bacterium]|nr:polysaccharide biosynthesis/export family protein [Candidatus Krumholzibacteria bacterium]
MVRDMRGEMRYTAVIFGAVLCALLVLCTGCGGGNRLVVNRGGEVEKLPFSADSLPSGPWMDEYYIGYGDVVDVHFFYNEKYSREAVKVRPDGRISYPYIGDVVVAGKTVSQVDSLLTMKFSEILRAPEITVIIREFEPQMIYVMGQVGNPGGYRYQKGLTLMSALAMGSGLRDSAKRNGVVIVRRLDWNHIVGIEVDVDRIIDDNRYDLDVPMRPFDIVMVPKSRLASTEDFIESFSAILLKPMDVYLKGWNVANVKAVYDFYKSSGQAR